jgi:hypothetical protein
LTSENDGIREEKTSARPRAQTKEAINMEITFDYPGGMGLEQAPIRHHPR